MEITRIEQWLWYLNIAGNVAMLLALLGRKLAGVYRVLFLYFTVDLVQSLLGLVWPAFIAPVYATTQPLKWILSFWFVLELYGRVLAPQAALAKLRAAPWARCWQCRREFPWRAFLWDIPSRSNGTGLRRRLTVSTARSIRPLLYSCC